MAARIEKNFGKRSIVKSQARRDEPLLMTFPLIFIVGPTASGKTALALASSTRLQTEIVSMDSMQIYKSLDIGTGKPTPNEQAQVRHHLIDIKNPDELYSAAQWAHDARLAIAEIRGRGKTPVVVGGTGFYARALLQPETLASAPPDFELRARLQTELENFGAQSLHAHLRAVDFVAAQRLQPNDTRRVMRAIEIAQTPGAPTPGAPTPNSKFKIENFLVFGLNLPRELLYQRIEKRIEAMLQLGFMEELRRLNEMDLPPNATAIHSLGYKQMRPVLDDATRFDECLETWKRDTRRYAKRQMTWFRHQLPTRWIEVDDGTDWPKIADQIAFEYSKSVV